TTIVVAGTRDPAAEAPPEDLVKAVRTAYESGSRMVSVCTGAFVLAEAGILDGRRATTHWRYSDLFGARYPAVKVDPDFLYTDESDVLTAAGMAAGVDLCLHIVRTDYGSAIANTLARRLVTPPHRDGGQAQFIAPPAGSGEHVLSGLLSWVMANLDQPLTVADMSRRAGMSTRNLARRLSSLSRPASWAMLQCGRAFSRADTTRSANGSPSHCLASVKACEGSAMTRSPPIMRSSMDTA
ncbi:MAG: DJ-1/PfpI family protein, partial [Trebonia sp.]